MTQSPKSEPNSEDDLFYFESDHLALKGNQDYSEVLKTLFILTAQRERAIKDYNKVVELKKHYLENPFEAVEKLKSGEDLGVPPILSVCELPKVNFSKYDCKIPEDCLKQVYSNEPENGSKEHRSPEKVEKKHSSSNGTHNKPWSLEEQKKLEELLITYPPEAVESKRFEKIAAALGTRTTKQVTSRVQKYFLKLQQSGLPVPGRIPRKDKYFRKSGHKHQRFNHYLWKPTTFFPHLCTPVTMTDFEDTPVPNPLTSSDNVEGIPKGYTTQQETFEYNTNGSDVNRLPKKEHEAQMNLLKRIRQEKVRESEDFSSQYVHVGYRCDYCNEDPIVGGRWHCTNCRTESVDFCTDCILAQMYSENAHPVTHRFLLYHNDTETLSSFSDSESDSGKEDASNRHDEYSDSDNNENTMMNSEQATSNVCNSDNSLQYIKAEAQGDDSNESRAMDCEFSQTQIVSYDYLHSNLLFDSDR